MTRRRFLQGLAGGVLAGPSVAAWALDWEQESVIASQVRHQLEVVFGTLNMALDFRAIDMDQNELFRIQINAQKLMPVASAFKGFMAPYYFLHVPRDTWDYEDGSALYSAIVHSNNQRTGVVLQDVAQYVRGDENAIVKFNNFLLNMGLQNGLHGWNWEGSPTVGFTDPRFMPSPLGDRVVTVRGNVYPIDNVFTAEDLARGHDFITRGEFFSQSSTVREALQLSKTLLSIPSHLATSYYSPLERVYAPGYTGKDGILPASDIATGRVVNDAGALQTERYTYIVSFMSAGESESVVLNVLAEVMRQMTFFEQATPA